MVEADTIQSLEKENRVLRKKLERSEADRRRLEEANRQRESLLKQNIYDLENSKQALSATVEQFQAAQDQMVALNRDLQAAIAHLEQEVAERKQTEAALRQSEARNRAFLNAIPDLMFRIDRNGYHLDCKAPKHFETLLADHDLIGTHLRDTLSPALADKRMFYLQQALETKETQTFEYQIEVNHSLHHEEARIAAIDDNEVLMIVRDISARKQAEAELLQSRAIAQEQAHRLETALHELTRTQAQVIQSEKMSSLGQLVAGVAHEINNPVNFIYGNLSYANEYIRDLLKVLKLYQQHYPNPVAAIQDEVTAIDLDFLVVDLPKLLTSMRVGAERIQDIVRSLRNFSRMDEAEMKAVNIHDGIDSTLMILQNRLKDKPEHPAIEVIKEYGTLPLVECYAGQLNQVFMNIIGNAIDALEEQPPKHQPSQIRISTEAISAEWVRIQIADNGPGITPGVQQRLFDPFFTTKPVGKGTGLGMSISYQIVTEKHGGSLSCTSQPGQGTVFSIEIPLQPKNVAPEYR